MIDDISALNRETIRSADRLAPLAVLQPYLFDLAYVRAPAVDRRTRAGRGQQDWTLQRNGNTPAIMGHGDYIVARYHCRCNRPVIIVREPQRVRRGRT